MTIEERLERVERQNVQLRRVDLKGGRPLGT